MSKWDLKKAGRLWAAYLPRSNRARAIHSIHRESCQWPCQADNFHQRQRASWFLAFPLMFTGCAQGESRPGRRWSRRLHSNTVPTLRRQWVGPLRRGHDQFHQGNLTQSNGGLGVREVLQSNPWVVLEQAWASLLSEGSHPSSYLAQSALSLPDWLSWRKAKH